MTAAVYAETQDAIAGLAEEEAVRVARRDRLRRLLCCSDLLLEGAELANRDEKPKVGWRLRRQIRQLEYATLGEMTSGLKTPQQAVDCLFSLQSVLLDWLEPGYEHKQRREETDG